MKKSLMILSVLVLLCPEIAVADLVITEIMSSSNHSGTNGDWWELTNTGLTPIDLTDYSWDDDHAGVGQNIFGNITIGPGQSIIIINLTSGDVATWKLNWSLDAGTSVYGLDYFGSSFSGLGSADGVFLYNSAGNLVTSVTYPSRTDGISNEWDTAGTYLGFSVTGENGATLSSNVSPDIASPGYAVVINTPCTTLPGMVYWTDKDNAKIQRANPDCSSVEDILTAADGLSDPRGLAINLSNKKIYWADNGTDKIQCANLDGSNIQDLVTGLSYPADIALDITAGKIYWADTDLGKIQRVNIDGTGSIEEVISGLSQPYYLALDSTAGKVYWTYFDNEIIQKANLDGSEMQTITGHPDRARDIAIDADDGKIYFCDRDSSSVQRANLDGTNVEYLFGYADGLGRPHGIVLDIAAGKMVFTDTDTYTVYIANMDGTGSLSSLASGLNGPWGIDAISTRSVIYVDADAPGPIHDGVNWNDAFLYLQDALSAANPGDEIRVAEGTYTPDTSSANPTGTGDRLETFNLKQDVTIMGGYAGYNQPSPDERDVNMYETVLSGDLAGNDAQVASASDLETEPTRSDNTYCILTAVDAGDTLELDGFTITAGYADGTGGFFTSRGGGLTNRGRDYVSIPIITNCKFIGNWAIDCGGAIANSGNVGDEQTCAIITNCSFIANGANGSGGALHNTESDTIIINCIFTGNYASQGGGAMDNGNLNPVEGDSPVITNCVFEFNTTQFCGGAIHNMFEANPTIINCTFIRNSTTSSIGVGGGICNDQQSCPVISNTIFWDNSDAGGNDESAQIHNTDGLSISVINYSSVHGWTGGLGGSGNHGDDPLFADADGVDNIAGTEDDNLRLSIDSPCIDAGNNAVVTKPNDLDGHLRISDGNCDNTVTVDMGAYEFNWLYIGDFEGDDCDVDFGDFAAMAQSWLQDNPDIDIVPYLGPDGVIDLKELLVLVDNWLTGK